MQIGGTPSVVCASLAVRDYVGLPIAFSSLTFVFILDLGMVVIFTTYIYVTALITVISDVILDQTGQTRHQTVSFGVYIHKLIFAFILE